MGGFECSTLKLQPNKRLDVVAASRHDTFAVQDYQRMNDAGLLTMREGLRWHLIETSPGRFDFRSAIPMIRAAREQSLEIIWDLFHYGWPDNLDLFSADFVKSFGQFAKEFARVHSGETDAIPVISPCNEISWTAWAIGNSGFMYPHAKGRGHEVKMQLIRASMEAMDAIASINPRARFLQVDPLENLVASPDRPQDCEAAEFERLVRFQTFDILTGRAQPELGGNERFLGIIGLNCYDRNQTIYGSHVGDTLERVVVPPTSPLYRPLPDLLREVYERYKRPIVLAETGTEAENRPAWLRFVSGEVLKALEAGVPMQGLCLYPILNHPGWADERHVYNGMWDYANNAGERVIFQPLADELKAQQAILQTLRSRLPVAS